MEISPWLGGNFDLQDSVESTACVSLPSIKVLQISNDSNIINNFQKVSYILRILFYNINEGRAKNWVCSIRLNMQNCKINMIACKRISISLLF